MCVENLGFLFFIFFRKLGFGFWMYIGLVLEVGDILAQLGLWVSIVGFWVFEV